jgi:hypothetical protein
LNRRDLAHVKTIGDIASTARTPEQSEIARFRAVASAAWWPKRSGRLTRRKAPMRFGCFDAS